MEKIPSPKRLFKLLLHGTKFKKTPLVYRPEISSEGMPHTDKSANKQVSLVNQQMSKDSFKKKIKIVGV
jgi:hypothetical protein